MGKKIAPLLLSIFALVTTGCQTPSEEGGSANKGAGEYSTKKPGAAVALNYSVEGEPEPGTAVVVNLEVTAANAADVLQLSLSADDSLQLSLEETNVQFQDVKAGIVQTHQVMVTPVSAGRLFINAIVTVDRAGTQSARTFTVPIQVGPEVAEKADVGADENGERIISLPAEES